MKGLRGLGYLLLAALGFGALSSAADAHGGQRTSPALRGTEVFVPGEHRVPSFALRDQTGRIVTPAALKGQVYVVTFLDSICTKECPVAGRELAQVQRLLGRRSPLAVVVVSVHPGADTPATARTFIRKSGIKGSWHWLFGSRKQLFSVWTEYGVWVQPARGDITHTAVLYLIDRSGWMRVADGVPFPPSQLAESVLALDAGR